MTTEETMTTQMIGAEDVFVIAGPGLCYASVCVPVTEDREGLLRAIRAKLGPTGLDHGWKFCPEPAFRTGEPNPGPCEREEDRAHLLMSC